jgi:2-dehydro-3-deoxyphosphogluconate aldolase/(4S)-4-hydroxy-2-oxoglutarate aldolase
VSDFDRLTVLSTMIESGLVPVFYSPDIEIAKNVAKACFEGGAQLLEFTNRGDGAQDVFRELQSYRKTALRHLILGAGSIVDAPTAQAYIALGASFVVGPILNPAVARLCNRRRVAYLPGCGSATEILYAEELGCDIVKIFPAMQVGGPPFVKAMAGPCPWTRLMPTGGVSPDKESLSAWFQAGVACVGIGSELITKDILKSGDYEKLTRDVRSTIELIAKIRSRA